MVKTMMRRVCWKPLRQQPNESDCISFSLSGPVRKSADLEHLEKAVRGLRKQLQAAIVVQASMQQEIALLRNGFHAELGSFQETVVKLMSELSVECKTQKRFNQDQVKCHVQEQFADLRQVLLAEIRAQQGPSPVEKASTMEVAPSPLLGLRIPLSSSNVAPAADFPACAGATSKSPGLGTVDVSSDWSTEDSDIEQPTTESSGSGAPVLQLAGLVAKPHAALAPVPALAALGAATPQSGEAEALASLGSAGHDLGLCKPCAFIFKGGCQNGINCNFCHRCDAGEKKRRQKEKASQQAAAREQQLTTLHGTAEEGLQGRVALILAAGVPADPVATFGYAPLHLQEQHQQWLGAGRNAFGCA
jgi:hypothetical protein